MKLNINSEATVVLTNKLEKISRSALPLAARGTINKAAFDVKQKTMPESSARAFVKRNPNFFRANSRVEVAKGFDVKSMQSVVGFTSENLQGRSNYAVQDLEQQERGGAIRNRSFIPTRVARGGSDARPVRPGNRLGSINGVVNANKPGLRGKRRFEKFVKSVVHAGVGGHVIGNFNKKILWRIDSIRRRKIKIIGRSTVMRIKMTPIYSFEENRNVRVRGTGFMKSASNKSAAKMNTFYEAEARRQIDKVIR